MGYTGNITVEKKLYETTDKNIVRNLYLATEPYARQRHLLTKYHEAAYGSNPEFQFFLDAEFASIQDKDRFPELVKNILPQEVLAQLLKYTRSRCFDRFVIAVETLREKSATISLKQSVVEYKADGTRIMNIGRRYLDEVGTVITRQLYQDEDGQLLSRDTFIEACRFVDDDLKEKLGQIYDTLALYFSRYDAGRAYYDRKNDILKIVFQESAMYEKVDPQIAKYFCITSGEGYGGIGGCCFGVSFELKTKRDVQGFYKVASDFFTGDWWKDLGEDLDGFTLFLCAGY